MIILRRICSRNQSVVLRRGSSRICIDASHIIEKDYGSGVQRVTRNVIKYALKTQPRGPVSAVNLARGRIGMFRGGFGISPLTGGG